MLTWSLSIWHGSYLADDSHRRNQDCYETHWNCAVGLAAMLPSISHVYQLLTWTS